MLEHLGSSDGRAKVTMMMSAGGSQVDFRSSVGGLRWTTWVMSVTMASCNDHDELSLFLQSFLSVMNWLRFSASPPPLLSQQVSKLGIWTPAECRPAADPAGRPRLCFTAYCRIFIN